MAKVAVMKETKDKDKKLRVGGKTLDKQRVLTFSVMLGAFLLMADVSAGEVGTKVLFVFLSTLLFIVFYAVGCLLASLVRRYKTR